MAIVVTRSVTGGETDLKAEMLNIFYPIGSYYETSDTSFDPNVAWGGTWIEDTDGLVLVAQDTSTFATVGDTGGEETHTLVTAEMPEHKHRLYIAGDGGGSWAGVAGSPSNAYAGWNGSYTENTGGGGAHNNLQPYIVVKRWHRTA